MGGETGWEPRFIAVYREGAGSAKPGDAPLVAAAPLYLKAHSYGEYVFDWAWADAYQRHGLEYYPKGLVAVPFTPVPGARLLARDEPAREVLARTLTTLADSAQVSSVHVLFPQPVDREALLAQGWLLRRGVQFHWRNPGYAGFEDYLAHLAQPKRKKIRAERRKVREAGVTTTVLEGREIQDSDWVFFNRCYRHTYALHHSTPYLNLDFFRRLGESLPEHVMMVRAERNGQAIAASLLLHDQQALYGRYWGALDPVDCLHFEVSYYTPIEWAIARGIGRFEGGAQGEHKMARGFLPVETHSLHRLAHPGFGDAVARFLARESGGIDAYLDELAERRPLRV